MACARHQKFAVPDRLEQGSLTTLPLSHRVQTTPHSPAQATFYATRDDRPRILPVPHPTRGRSRFRVRRRNPLRSTRGLRGSR